MSHTVVMVATSYPRFEGDIVGTFMAPIAHGVAARGHAVHIVAPWHPAIARPAREGNVHFHFFRYAPVPSMNVFGYAGGLKADVSLRAAAWMAAPLALVAGWRMARRVARDVGATVMHGHWVIPGGVIANYARGGRPLVVSLHGSDVFVAEKHTLLGRLARGVFNDAAYVTACSADLAARAVALGARPGTTEVVPYGVDVGRFAPDPSQRPLIRQRLGLHADAPLVFAVGRFVRKKGFEYLIDAAGRLSQAHPSLTTVIAGDGDLADEFRDRARAHRLGDRVRFPGLLAHDEVAAWCAAADVIVVPSVRDDAGNVDGLPNVVLEALATATPVVATPAGGIGQVITDRVTGRLVAERDVPALADAIADLLQHPAHRRALGVAAREHVTRRLGWNRVAERMEAAYDLATAAPQGLPRRVPDLPGFRQPGQDGCSAGRDRP